MVTALPLRRLVFSPRRGTPSLLRSTGSLNRPPGYWHMAYVNVNNRFNALSKSIAAMKISTVVACLAVFGCALPAGAEDGYDLWLRYRAVEPSFSRVARAISAGAGQGRGIPDSGRRRRRAHAWAFAADRSSIGPRRNSQQGGAVIVGTPASSALIAGLPLSLERAGREGYVIRSVSINQRPAIVIAANTDIGVLYGAFHFLRLLQTRQPLTALDIASQPRTQLRVLNHWDNLDRHVERGYAGQSIWDWHKLPDYLDPRYTDYARANASLGINGTVLTNVNANATSLTPPYLREGRGAGRRVPSVRHPRVSDRALQRADRDRRPEDRGPARSAGAALVAGEGRRDLRAHPRFRRLPGQGQLRRTAGPAGLRPHACRRRQHARRCGGAARRRGDVARVRLLERSSPTTAPSRRTASSCRSTASSATTCWCR